MQTFVEEENTIFNSTQICHNFVTMLFSKLTFNILEYFVTRKFYEASNNFYGVKVIKKHYLNLFAEISFGAVQRFILAWTLRWGFIFHSLQLR